MNTALIVGVYNRDDFLRLVLESVLRQSYSPHEVVIAEDGQNPNIRRVFSDYQKAFQGRLKHVYHQDLGNRKPLILNKAVACTNSDYLIFIDGDCVLRRDFVEDHLRLARPDSFLTGRRIELSPKASQILTPKLIQNGYLDHWPIRLYIDALFGKTQHFGRFFKTPFVFRKILKRDEINDIRGCNFSLSRKAFENVNGYSNDFSGAYGEDSDLEYRLKFAGYKMRGNKGACIQFHLWHPTQEHDKKNQEKLERVLAQGESYTPNGLKECLNIP